MNKLNLADGRTVSYEIYGDPKGKPLFYLHGWPGSRISAVLLHKAAKKLGYKVIAPDRPGFGDSAFKKNRILLDYPHDIKEIAEKLGYKTISVIGVSGGGPYALALAFLLPKFVNSVIISSGLGPTIYTYKNLSLRQEIYLFRWKLSKTITPPFLPLMRCAIFSIPKQYGNFQIMLFSKHDKILMTNYSIRRLFLCSNRQAFKQGIEGPAQDIRIYTSTWGFDLSEIKSRVIFWHGDDDKNVPLWMAEKASEKIKNSKLHIIKNSGHFLLARHAEKILRSLDYI